MFLYIYSISQSVPLISADLTFGIIRIMIILISIFIGAVIGLLIEYSDIIRAIISAISGTINRIQLSLSRLDWLGFIAIFAVSNYHIYDLVYLLFGSNSSAKYNDNDAGLFFSNWQYDSTYDSNNYGYLCNIYTT